MAKITKKENIHVEIIPITTHVHIDPDLNLLTTCQDIVDQVKRHIDDVESVCVEYDKVDYCEFCNEVWKPVKATNSNQFAIGEPLCCGKAQDEWKQRKETPDKAKITDKG